MVVRPRNRPSSLSFFSIADSTPLLVSNSDNLVQLTDMMSYSLPSRDLIADSMEMVSFLRRDKVERNHR